MVHVYTVDMRDCLNAAPDGDRDTALLIPQTMPVSNCEVPLEEDGAAGQDPVGVEPSRLGDKNGEGAKTERLTENERREIAEKAAEARRQNLPRQC
jgi:hypothetical protein